MKNTARNSLKKFPPLFHLLKWIYFQIVAIGAIPKWKKLRKNKIIKLELGSRKPRPGWTTVDIEGADISHDLRRGLPLEDETVDAIYTSHMFEHIPYKELIALIAECKRVLKKNGTLSVCVPNAELYIRAYVEGKQFEDQSLIYKEAAVETDSFLDQVNYIAYMAGAHAYMFDQENLVNTLKKGGFKNVTLRTFDSALDSEKFDYLSIYAIAIK